MTGEGVDEKAVLRAMGEQLPRYMVPAQLHVLEVFPLNSNGKIDRKALRATLDSE